MSSTTQPRAPATMTPAETTNDRIWPPPGVSEEELIARYGLRRLSAAERGPFPRHTLAVDLFKARILKIPGGLPRLPPGTIVWLGEFMPGIHTVRLPGGCPLIAEHIKLVWERVPLETPVTTIDELIAQERAEALAAQRWRPGQRCQTPDTRLTWSDLTGWLAAWDALQGRRNSRRRDRQLAQHLQTLPVEMVTHEADEGRLYAFLDALQQDDGGRPTRGQRSDHPTTPLLMAAHNRLAQLDALPYRAYCQQRALGRSLPVAQSRSAPAVPDKAADHLSLF